VITKNTVFNLSDVLGNSIKDYFRTTGFPTGRKVTTKKSHLRHEVSAQYCFPLPKDLSLLGLT
jgi:hypothetical protein